MFLLYLDASGTPQASDQNTKHYVLVGLGLKESDWYKADSSLGLIKKRYLYSSQDISEFEIHVKQFDCDIKEQNEISDFEKLSYEVRREKVLELQRIKIAREPKLEQKLKRIKRYKQTDPYIHLSRTERTKLLDEVLELISGLDIKLFSDAISKSHPSFMSGSLDPVKGAFTQVVTRFDKFLDNRAVWEGRYAGEAYTHFGMLILDNDGATEQTIHNLFLDFRKRGHPFGKLTKVIDVPFFAESHQVSALQLADVVAAVVRRYLDKGGLSGSREEARFLKLFKFFDRDPSGKLHGIRHYIPAKSCDCLICHERGHGPLEHGVS
ncbi:DUF3800 domain-containing protein [Telmatocola sphagniphila]|uniref:DUF3800 domain-containing protein n=1 Tax=Telmatocola sphagniphila TaxID=1123043 RepID=A0A8E6B5Z8_9BACT|nr:DUF3800 domain-containing protein [Telmatocola sphagniphila]QVL32371.1 DUF3800 domain-containing protein [Telmatocola sphagniphila]